jgi:hypothetical protein
MATTSRSSTTNRRNPFASHLVSYHRTLDTPAGPIGTTASPGTSWARGVVHVAVIPPSHPVPCAPAPEHGSTERVVEKPVETPGAEEHETPLEPDHDPAIYQDLVQLWNGMARRTRLLTRL